MGDPDVLVVGGGLGAYAAALAAARHDPDASVHLVASPDSPFDRASGLIDVLGVAPDGTQPLADPFATLGDLPDGHPYRRLGTDALRDGLALFDDATGGDYAGGHTDVNALVPTVLGALAPTARYPAAVAPGLASREASTLLVGFEGLPDFHAPTAADRLSAAGVPFDVEGVTTTAPVGADDESPAVAFASALDEASGTDSVRDAVADRVASLLDDETRVGLPAVLGVDRVAEVHAAIADAVDATVFEVPLGPPSVLGRRLEASLRSALDAAGVDRSLGTVADYEAAGGRLARVELSADGPGADRTAEPGAVVLATGGPADGGIVADRDAVREPTFDCHVLVPDADGPRARTEPFGDHPFARYGVDVDDATRPLDGDGAPVYENCFAAGSVVGGHDFVGEGSVGGVALATGVVAGREAASNRE